MSNCLKVKNLIRHSRAGGNPLKKMKQASVYILANKSRGTLYTGVTSDLIKRVWEHKNDCVAGFTNKYSIHNLVYYELHETIETAILREKQIKKWNRAWKIRLIEEFNPKWKDLYNDII